MWRGPRRRRDRILLRVVFYGSVAFAVLPWVFSSLMIAPYRQGGGGPEPGFEEGWLPSDGLRLRTWLLRRDGARATVVVAHGFGDAIESYAGMARHFGARGHSVLLLEMRGHGRSDGEHTTLGGRESRDVRAAMDWLRGQGLAPRGFVVSGVSMGAVAVLLAAAGRDDVRAAIGEAPYDSYRETMAHHASLFYGLPRWVPILPLSIALAEWRAGFDADEVDCVAAARRLRAPLLLIVDGADPRMPEPVVRRILDAHPGPKRLWVAPGEPHAGASLNDGYWPTVEAFLSENGL
ncbi:MAG TPA: alpha/beta fold hydrolase [Vicinamibacteria bacterium]|nr:alpha/beta fold hydrolase [Vicinamibacteria bacterium]